MAVAKGGRAIVRFDDGCEYTLEDDEVLTIGDVSTCCALEDAFSSHSVASQNPVLDIMPARATPGDFHAMPTVAHDPFIAPTVATPSTGHSAADLMPARSSLRRRRYRPYRPHATHAISYGTPVSSTITSTSWWSWWPRSWSWTWGGWWRQSQWFQGSWWSPSWIIPVSSSRSTDPIHTSH